MPSQELHKAPRSSLLYRILTFPLTILQKMLEIGPTILAIVAIVIFRTLFGGKGARSILKKGECVDDGPSKNSAAAYKKAAKPLAFSDRKREMPPRLAADGVASKSGCPPTTLPALFQ